MGASCSTPNTVVASISVVPTASHSKEGKEESALKTAQSLPSDFGRQAQQVPNAEDAAAYKSQSWQADFASLEAKNRDDFGLGTIFNVIKMLGKGAEGEAWLCQVGQQHWQHHGNCSRENYCSCTTQKISSCAMPACIIGQYI